MTGTVDAHVAPGFPVVGVVGGGQLARMMQQPAIALGIGLRVLATSIEDSAAQAVRDVALGRHDDLDDAARVRRRLRRRHVRPRARAAGATSRRSRPRASPCAPAGARWSTRRTRSIMREALTEVGVPCPRVGGGRRRPTDVAAFAETAGWPVVLKTSRGGYDGRGVWVSATPRPCTT